MTCINKCTEPSLSNDTISVKSESIDSQQNVIMNSQSVRLPISNIPSKIKTYKSHLMSQTDQINMSQDALDNSFALNLNDSFHHELD